MFGLRQRINLFIYDNRSIISSVMGWVMAVSSIAMIGSLVYYHGFTHTPEKQAVLLDVNRAFFALFILNYLIKLLFSLDRKSFIKSSKLELTLLSLVVLNFISYQILNLPLLAKLFGLLGWVGFEPYYVFFIQCYLLFLILLEVLKSLHVLNKIKVKPTTLFLFSFLGLIATGTFLLKLPALSIPDVEISWVDALFTSASASCVTGLIVVDTATFFNTKGQIVIMLLVQIGGLGIISFATFFATFMKQGVSLRQQTMIKELIDNESINASFSLLRKVVFYTFAIELISAILIYSFWGNYPFANQGERIFYSIFHAISSFCNAGLYLFSNGFIGEGLENNYLLLLSIAATIFMGSLGFPAIRDIFELGNVRERLNKPWKKWKLSTQIAFYGSLVLVVLGTFSFYFLEKDGLLAGKGDVHAFVTSLFHSVNARSGGINSVNFGMASVPTLMIFIFLMFVGSSSGGTGGGIKTSTFVVIFTAILATVAGKKEVTMGRRTLSQELIYKAFAVFIFSASFIFVCAIVLAILEPDIPVLQLVFEEVSAFATVGLSTGITSGLSDYSKMVLIISMFVGRVGVLSLAFSLSVSTLSNSYRYPKSHIMIG